MPRKTKTRNKNRRFNKKSKKQLNKKYKKRFNKKTRTRKMKDGGGLLDNLLHELKYTDGFNVFNKNKEPLYYRYNSDEGILKIRELTGGTPIEHNVLHMRVNDKYTFRMPAGEYSFIIIRKANNNFVVGQKIITAYADTKIPSENIIPLPSNRVSEISDDDEEDDEDEDVDEHGMPFAPKSAKSYARWRY